MEQTQIIYMLAALVLAALIAFTTTPAVSVLAYKIGAIDVPKDNRRMHKKPMPLLGGLAIFLGFTISGLLFCELTPSMIAAWFGGPLPERLHDLLVMLVGGGEVFPMLGKAGGGGGGDGEEHHAHVGKQVVQQIVA